jgi:hypothetical protein
MGLYPSIMGLVGRSWGYGATNAVIPLHNPMIDLSSFPDDCLNSSQLPLRSGRIRVSLGLDHLNFKEDEASHEWEGSSSLKFR